MMYKGRYVAVIEYDFAIDESAPNVRPIEQIKDMFTTGIVERGIKEVLFDDIFDPSIGDCKVTQTYFDMYSALPEEARE